MAERNEDDLNQFSRKGYPDILDAAIKGTNEAYSDAARPTADILLPAINEHVIGQCRGARRCGAKPARSSSTRSTTST